MKVRVCLPLMALLVLTTPVTADQWMAAVAREQSSSSGEFSVRVTPGNSWGDVEGFAGSPKGSYATAEWYRSNGGKPEKIRTTTLLNPVAPVDFRVTNDGTLVTLDNWHNVGYGSVLVVYAPDGEVLKKYSLGELFPYRDIQDFAFSASSILWRCETEEPLAQLTPTELRVDDTIGGRLVIRTDTGNVEYRRRGGSCDRRPPVAPPAPIPERVLALPWGDEAEGLRLNVNLGNVTGPLPYGDRLNLDLQVWIRNLSPESIASTIEGATYNFEYEIDGTWYAFDTMPALRTFAAAVRAKAAARVGARETDLTLKIEPSAVMAMYLPLPLVAPSPTLQLHAITGEGAGHRFEPTEGVHTLRIRAQGAVEAGRALVSNPISFTLRSLPKVETRNQDVSFISSRGTPLGNLRFVSGPKGDQDLIRRALARPPQPVSAPLIHSTNLQVFEPLPVYDLRLPAGAAQNPDLPATFTGYRYLVRNPNEFAAIVELASYTEGPLVVEGGPVFVAMSTANAAGPLFNALQQLAGIDAIRGGGYEPRLLRVSGERITSALQVLWLHSSTGKPDLFYRPADPEYRGATRVESGKTYTYEEFLSLVRGAP